jgi:hypothetical protein
VQRAQRLYEIAAVAIAAERRRAAAQCLLE